MSIPLYATFTTYTNHSVKFENQNNCFVDNSNLSFMVKSNNTLSTITIPTINTTDLDGNTE